MKAVTPKQLVIAFYNQLLAGEHERLLGEADVSRSASSDPVWRAYQLRILRAAEYLREPISVDEADAAV